MKKLDNIIILISALLLSFAMLSGCSKEEDRSALEESSVVFFHAVTESGGTKTVLENGDSETESHPVLWTPGDAIWVGTASASGRYEYKGTQNTASADFGGTLLKGSYYYSIYPYSDTVSLSNGIISFGMPSAQEYAPLSFGPAASPMVAVSSSTTLEFRNLCGLLKLNLLGEVSIRSISFSGRDAAGNDIPVSGAATVDMNYSSVPKLVMSPDANTSVILDCGEGVALSPSETTPFYIALPPGTYDEFTLNIVSTDGTVMVKSSSALVINRSMVKPTAELYFEAGSGQPSDRDALIAFYNATDGPNWTDNTNWCSDEPLDTWYGITTDSEGRVTRISLANNGLSGATGNTLAPLTALTTLLCSNNNLSNLDLSNNTALTHLYCENNSLSDLDLSNNTALRYLYCENNNLSELDLSGNTALTLLSCYSNSLSELDLSGNVALTDLHCSYNNLSELDLSGNTALASLDCGSNNLSDLDLSNNVALTRLYCFDNNLSNLDLSNNTALTSLDCYNNNLSNLDLSNNVALTTLWCYSNNLSELDLSNNTALTSLSCFGNNMTVLDIRNNVNLGDNVEVGCQAYADGNYEYMYLYVTEAQLEQWNNTWSGKGWNEYVVVSTQENYFYISPRSFNVPASGQDITVKVTGEDYTVSSIPSWITDAGQSTMYGDTTAHVFTVSPNSNAGARSGEIVFTSIDGSFSNYVTVFQKGQIYESTDYSADGQVELLQSATVGNGIDIVLMGDAYSDRLIADGTYRSVMVNTMEQFFSEEPYKSFRDYFNVYMVKVVSPNDVYETGSATALSTWFTEGSTHVGGDDQKVFKYARKAISSDRLDEALLVVMMNRDYYAGTCYMYYPQSGDYGNGVSVSYFPTSSDEATFRGLILHEAGGHGFSKLADEYSYYMGEIPSEEITDCMNQWDFGWYKNIDFTDDLTKIGWAGFLADERYQYDGLGAFEGGFTYLSGVWRPTENSIMRHNDGGYNAPSRERIYIRIHKLAFGADWQYDYEEFVAYDAINRKTSPSTAPAYVRSFEPTAPPVVIRKTWREVMAEPTADL